MVLLTSKCLCNRDNFASSSENDKIPITYGYLKNITFGNLENALINFKIDNNIDLKSEGYILNIEKEKIFIIATWHTSHELSERN